MEAVVDLIKLWLIYLAINQPEFYVALAIVLGSILLFFGCFVKLKNGWLSWVAYFILIAGCTSLGCLNMTMEQDKAEEDLRLRRPQAIQVDSVDSQGVYSKLILRIICYRYLGIQMPDGSYNNEAIKRVESLIKGKTAIVYVSPLYQGYVITDKDGTNINELLLSEGLATVTSTSPKKYKTLQDQAKKQRLGLWKDSYNCQLYGFTEYPRMPVERPLFTLVLILCSVFSVLLVSNRKEISYGSKN